MEVVQSQESRGCIRPRRKAKYVLGSSFLRKRWTGLPVLGCASLRSPKGVQRTKRCTDEVDEIADVWGSVKPDMWTYFKYEIANLCREVQQSRSNEVPHDGQPRK